LYLKPRLGTEGLKNEIRHVINQPPDPKNGVGAPKSVWSCDPLIGNFKFSKNKYTFENQKVKNKPSEPKNLLDLLKMLQFWSIFKEK
jgi:hypothetical protein